MSRNHDSDQPASAWRPARCVSLSGDPSTVGVKRWHLDGVDFNAETGRCRLRGWMVQPEQGPAVHVLVGRCGEWSSYLPNDIRPDVARKLDAQGVSLPAAPWCGFDIEQRGHDRVDIGFERDGCVVWLRRCSAPDLEKSWSVSAPGPAPATAVTDAGLDEEHLLRIARRYYGPGQARLLGSHEPPDSRKKRVHVHEIEIDGDHPGRRVRLVEKRQATAREMTLARRLLAAPGEPRPDGFVSVLEIAGKSPAPGWFVCEYVEPQPDMYLDSTPYLDPLVEAVVHVNRRFADLADESQRTVVMAMYQNAIDRFGAVDQRLGTAGVGTLGDAMPVLGQLPLVASHNDFYWNNLGLMLDGDGREHIHVFDLEILGPNLMGAEFHQFARMSMESDSLRAPFYALIERYARSCGAEPRRLRIAALAYAVVRSGMRLHSGTAAAKGADGSPRCEEPEAWAGMLEWLAGDMRKLRW